MKNHFKYIAFALFLTLFGCEGEGPIRLRSNTANAANTDGARGEILAMSQFDLDQCKISLGSPSPSSVSIGGSSVGTANAQSDRSDWNSALDKSAQIFGDEEPENTPGASINAAPAARESITGIRILTREDIGFARVDIASNTSNTARLITRGTATVTRQVPTRGGGFETQVANAEVDLVYNLINGSRGWLCSSVQAEVREPLDEPGPETRTKKDFGNRIGW